MQNYYLWKKYQTGFSIEKDRNGRDPIEKFLWHGTDKTDPRLITSTEKGFTT